MKINEINVDLSAKLIGKLNQIETTSNRYAMVQKWLDTGRISPALYQKLCAFVRNNRWSAQ